MTAEAELEKVWECPDCNTVQDDPEPGYECPKCSNQFMKSEGNGRGHQCPDCNSFSTKIGDKVCPDCKVELEEVERINDDGEWKTQEQYDTDHPEGEEDEDTESDSGIDGDLTATDTAGEKPLDDDEMGETPNTVTEAIAEREAHDAREGFTPELHEPLPPETKVGVEFTPQQEANIAVIVETTAQNPTTKGGETKMTIQDGAEYTVSGTSWKGYVVKVVAEEGNKAEIEVVSLNGKTTGKQVGRKFKVQMSHLTPVTPVVAA